MAVTLCLDKTFLEQKFFCFKGTIPFAKKCRKNLDPSDNFSTPANIVEFEKYETAAMLKKLVTSQGKVLELTSQNYCHIGYVYILRMILNSAQ